MTRSQLSVGGAHQHEHDSATLPSLAGRHHDICLRYGLQLEHLTSYEAAEIAIVSAADAEAILQQRSDQV